MLNGGVTAARTNLAVGLMALAASLGSLAPARVVRAQTVVGPSFQVVVSVSSRAAARLANPRETVVVDVEFYGVPISVKLRMADEGRLDLAPEQKIELAGAGGARFAGPKIDAAKLKSVQGGKLEVAIEGYSGRHSSPDNLLICDSGDDIALQAAAAKSVQMRCKLIAEP